MNFTAVCKTSVNSLTNLHLKHAHCDLEEDGGTLIEKQIPDPEEHLHVNHTGEYSEEPVQADQGELCNDMHGATAVSVSQHWTIGYHASSQHRQNVEVCIQTYTVIYSPGYLLMRRIIHVKLGKTYIILNKLHKFY